MIYLAEYRTKGGAMGHDIVRQETFRLRQKPKEADVANEDLYKGLVRHLESVSLWLKPDYKSITASYLKHRDITDITELQRRRQAVEALIVPLRRQRIEDYSYDARLIPSEHFSPMEAYNLMREIDLGFEGEVIDFLIKANANRKSIPGDFSTGMDKFHKDFNTVQAPADTRQ